MLQCCYNNSLVDPGGGSGGSQIPRPGPVGFFTMNVINMNSFS